jgi:hypothetical protein
MLIVDAQIQLWNAVNRISGPPEEQLRERHDADSGTKTQDKATARG